MVKRYDMNNILHYVLNDDTDEECHGSDLDGEREGSNTEYESDVEVQPMQGIIDNDVTLDDNDIYTTDIDKQQQVETAREKSPVASNGSGDTPTLLDDLIKIESDDNDGADIQLAQCQHVHTDEDSTLVEELGYMVLQEHLRVLVAIEYVYVVADEDILAKAMPDKEIVMVRLMIGNGKAQILGTIQIWKILFLPKTKGSR